MLGWLFRRERRADPRARRLQVEIEALTTQRDASEDAAEIAGIEERLQVLTRELQAEIDRMRTWG
ncbi:hypothetical protein [Roseobacter sp. HKCCA0434]|uniref:hypothetical protein n=1 Tax=Roseobacter sp. HKCCA0434 TaxID=3079297 RepID=UPI002905C8E8|nr:hypothetical protein [Roseobacter sp. HKCCA0434]